MEYRQVKNKNDKLAFLFSGIFSLFGLISNSPRSDSDILLLLLGWSLTFGFLIAAWYLNSTISNRFAVRNSNEKLPIRIIIIILINSCLLLLFISLSESIYKYFSFNRGYNYNYLIVRGIISIAIIYLLQYTLNLNEKNQSVLLQNQILKTENIRAQFEILRQQISPHFLFNSLSSLRYLIRSSPKDAEEFVLKLSDIYRLLLANKELDTVKLREELVFVDNYSFLLFARYGNALKIAIDIHPNLLELKIPTFTIQLLLENSVKHNIISGDKPLNIKIYGSGSDSIFIENNLQSKVSVEPESGIGLRNLMKRYELLNTDNGVQIFADESMFRVKVKLLSE